MSITHSLSFALSLVAVVSFAPRPHHAPVVHEIRIEGDTASEQFRFTPRVTTAVPGDVLQFTVVSGAPHSVVFEVKGLTPAAHAALNASMPARLSDLSGPMLRAKGDQYRVVVPALAAGTYHFYCLMHRAYNMGADLRIDAPHGN
ncbi:MAG: plastocyanin/azurin family copper-binding protein [Gemmatimonadota bacterium]